MTHLVAGEAQAAHQVSDLLREAAARKGGVQLTPVEAALAAAGVRLQGKYFTDSELGGVQLASVGAAPAAASV